MNVRDEFKNNTVEQNQAIARAHTKGFAVATFNLKGDLNLGTIMRTAHLTGAERFFILGHRGFDRRSSVGVQNYLIPEKHDECKDYLTTNHLLYHHGYTPVIVEQGGKKFKDWLSLSNHYGFKPCFVFGPEEGFPSDFPAHIELEQTGVSRSYNVSSAAAIVLYNWSFGR